MRFPNMLLSTFYMNLLTQRMWVLLTIRSSSIPSNPVCCPRWAGSSWWWCRRGSAPSSRLMLQLDSRPPELGVGCRRKTDTAGFAFKSLLWRRQCSCCRARRSVGAAWSPQTWRWVSASACSWPPRTTACVEWRPFYLVITGRFLLYFQELIAFSQNTRLLLRFKVWWRFADSLCRLFNSSAEGLVIRTSSASQRGSYFASTVRRKRQTEIRKTPNYYYNWYIYELSTSLSERLINILTRLRDGRLVPQSFSSWDGRSGQALWWVFLLGSFRIKRY